FGMPAVDRDGITGFAIVVRQDRRKLLDGNVRRKLVPLVVEPRLGIEGRVFARALGIVPAPRFQIIAFRVTSEQNFRSSCCVTFGLVEHGEGIGGNGLIAVNTGLNVPASEVSAEGLGEGAGTEASDRSALPVAVVDVGGFESWLARSSVLQRLADGPAPR